MLRKNLDATMDVFLDKILEPGERILWKDTPGLSDSDRKKKGRFIAMFVMGLVSIGLGLILMLVFQPYIGEAASVTGFIHLILGFGEFLIFFGGIIGLIGILMILYFSSKNRHYFLTDKKIIRIDYTSILPTEDGEDLDRIRILRLDDVQDFIIKPPINVIAKKRTFKFYGDPLIRFNVIKNEWQELTSPNYKSGFKKPASKQKYIEFNGISDWEALYNTMKKELT